MKKIFIVSLLILAGALIISPETIQGQPGGYRGGYGPGPGMMRGYSEGYEYGMGPGMMDDWVDVPSKLPAPKNTEWVKKLRDILASEKESLAQYKSDEEKYNVYMPYMMVIPQEENHIYWIEQLFAAYGLPSGMKQVPVVQSTSLTEAYKLAVKLEADLLPRYEWLIKNAGDRDTAQTLDTILLQSRWHWAMFQHALGSDGRYGFGPGRGMMHWRYGLGYGFPGMLMGILFLIILALVIYLIIKKKKSKHGDGSSEITPLEILKKRYALGEISKEEFKRIKNDIK